MSQLPLCPCEAPWTPEYQEDHKVDEEEKLAQLIEKYEQERFFLHHC